MSSTDPFGLCPLGFLNLDWSTIGHALLDVVGIVWDGADLINAMWYKAEGNDFMAGVCLLSALPMLGSFAGGAIKAVATGTKYLNKAETVAKYLTLGTKLVSHTAQATMSGIDTYYAAVDAYEAYQAGELGAQEIINFGLAATGTILSTGAAISSGRGLYKLMGSDGVGCKVMTGITGEPHCFVAGTPVSTEEGQRAIEEVEAGDKVWAYDEETGEKGLKEVEEVFVSETDKLIHVETDREEIITTELHPFYVEGIGFVQAGCLQEGYELKCLDGGKEVITDVRVEWLEEPVEVYNFEVADYHTYYVGDVLVHNTCSKAGGNGEGAFGKYTFKEGIDTDLRGKGTYKDALDIAFEKTGLSKEEFNVTRWSKDKYGKSFLVEWRANNGAEVSIDLGHSPTGDAPTVPHIGWQTGGKRGSGGAVRGRIFVDDVPYNRKFRRLDMFKISSHICSELENSKVILKKLELTEREKILDLVLKKYIDSSKAGGWLWEKFIQYEALNDNMAWGYIKHFVSNNECVMFFNQEEEKEMFLVQLGEDLDYILSETYGFEFYITDKQCTYLFCFNHHDILYGCGTAESWVNSIKGHSIESK